MIQIPFTVSARAARLIGRENVSSATGALTELVKNSHDADATYCYVVFEIQYSSVPSEVPRNEFHRLAKRKARLNSLYIPNETQYVKRPDLSVAEAIELESIFKDFNSIYLIDNGHGMTEEVIKSSWMTIGTDNKLLEPETKKGRLKSGAKGIGRFALDRLGTRCEMHTQDSSTKKCLRWIVNWDQFEEQNRAISDITASLENVNIALPAVVDEISFGVLGSEEALENFKNISSGTILKISSLRDWWKDDDVKNAYQRFQSLIPPSFEKHFGVSVIDSRDPSSYGPVQNDLADDFDYNIKASFDGKNAVKVILKRNEFDVKKFPAEYFKLIAHELEDQKPYRKLDLEKDSLEFNFSLQKLFNSEHLDPKEYESVGPFTCDISFFKHTSSSRDDARFHYRYFDSTRRKLWIEKNMGIRLYRDNFKVRPYGELQSGSFDWLGLGARAASNPAGVGNLNQKWRARSNQVSGSVNISRLKNPNLMDKSSREGLVENYSLEVFKLILTQIIQVFETDRQTIMRYLDRCVQDDGEKKVKHAEALARDYKNSKSKSDKSSKVFIEALEAQKEQIRYLEDENKLLMRLASAGLSISSFAHEIKAIHSSLEVTTVHLEKRINQYIDTKKIIGIEDHHDPRVLIKDLIGANQKMNTWIMFSLDSLRRDKRTQKSTDFSSYLNALADSWHTLLKRQDVDLKIVDLSKEVVEKKIYQIDFDSIFSNLIINSITAFANRKDGEKIRNIEITLRTANRDGRKVGVIEYVDSGPGLDKTITNSNLIFEPLYTTKTNEKGEKIGTGLGMWIVKKIIADYGGDIHVTRIRPGFGVKFEVPL